MKTAVFYDLENMGLPLKNGEFEREFAALTEKIKASELVGTIALQRAYISKSNTSAAHIAPLLAQQGVELVEVAPLSDTPRRKKSNLVDFKMTVDIIAAIATRRSIETVGIASGDSDFGFLGQKVKELGKNLLVISRPAIVGDSMLQLCDDWVDPSGTANLSKYILRAIETRIVADYSGDDFMTALGDFLQRLEKDPFIRRCMVAVGLPFPMFIANLRRRGVVFPSVEKLGFPNISSFMAIALRNAPFRLECNHIRYRSQGQLPSTEQLAVGLLGIPGGYSREKLLRYYDILAGIDNADELITYIQFMKRCGMLRQQILCPKRTYRAVIRRNLTEKMASAGIELDRTTLTKLNRML